MQRSLHSYTLLMGVENSAACVLEFYSVCAERLKCVISTDQRLTYRELF